MLLKGPMKNTTQMIRIELDFTATEHNFSLFTGLTHLFVWKALLYTEIQKVLSYQAYITGLALLCFVLITGRSLCSCSPHLISISHCLQLAF